MTKNIISKRTVIQMCEFGFANQMAYISSSVFFYTIICTYLLSFFFYGFSGGLRVAFV